MWGGQCVSKEVVGDLREVSHRLSKDPEGMSLDRAQAEGWHYLEWKAGEEDQ